MKQLTQALLALLLAYLVALSWADPLTDVARTTIDVSETQTTPSTERFAVRVRRVDNIIDDNGDLVAAKAMAVIINFDVRDDQIVVNNVPVRLGVSSVEIIEAEIMASDLNETETKAIEHAFNVTLATVEVASSAESFATSDPSVTLRRVTIRIRVIEVDGEEVVQTDAVERILELRVAAPAIHDLADPQRTGHAANSGMHHHNHKSHGCFRNLRNHIRHWWNCSSRFVRVTIVSSGFAVLFGLCFIAIPALYRRIRPSPYERVSFEEAPQIKVDQIIYIADDEKRALMQRDDQEDQQRH
jgi:hypothetical protein